MEKIKLNKYQISVSLDNNFEDTVVEYALFHATSGDAAKRIATEVLRGLDIYVATLFDDNGLEIASFE